MLKSIYRSLELADLVLTITGCETQRLLHIDIFLKISIQKDSFHIHLLTFIIMKSYNRKQSANRFQYGHGRKGFMIINTFTLTIIFRNQSYLIGLYLTIRFNFFFYKSIYTQLVQYLQIDLQRTKSD